MIGAENSLSEVYYGRPGKAEQEEGPDEANRT